MNKKLEFLPAPVSWEEFRKILDSSEEVLSRCLLRGKGAVVVTAPSGKKEYSPIDNIRILLKDGSILEYGVVDGEVLPF